ncbi:MAG: PEP-utilizing enzyme, partial [Candidatus Methylomirabilaceae bacterium]
LYGAGTALVSGECDADAYRVHRDARILSREVAEKRTTHRYDPRSSEGIRTTTVPDEIATLPALDDDEIRAVAELSRRAGRHLGRPQDIEWAIEGGRLYLLQSRPVTSLSNMADPDGMLQVWDNSNIAESYGGVTTPLTFSFARHVYGEVYRQFCRLMHVPDRTIAGHNHLFRCMLGLVRGRVYYNLLNWYRLLTLLPGFAVNRRFMEQMMGVREGLPDSLLADLKPPTWHHRLKDLANLIVTVGGLAVAYILLPYRITRFHRRLDGALGPSALAVEDLRADELAAYYRGLERRLITRWDAPLINDFFTMSFFGILGRLTERWCGDTEGSLRNELLRGDGEVISAQPARWVRELAEMASGDPGFAALLRTGTLDSILAEKDRVPGFESRYSRYLSTFGDRCPGELKLESLTLHDDPLPLLRSVGQLALRIERVEAPPLPGPEVERRRLAERRVRERMAGSPLARAVFHWVLANARARVRDREDLRLQRTRLFGSVRRIFLEIGKRFSSLDLLDSTRDIFYLELDEILGFIEGTSTSTNLRGLVSLRKTEFSAYRQSEPPPDRFETVGIVHHCGTLMAKRNGASDAGGEVRKGMGCSPGVARGPIRLITDPRSAVLQKGEILVAERTDPGWVLLFPCASGLLVERGSLLSHSAIVARELGIPAVIAVGGVTRWLKDGDVVELDGSSGEVRRLESKDRADAR